MFHIRLMDIDPTELSESNCDYSAIPMCVYTPEDMATVLSLAQKNYLYVVFDPVDEGERRTAPSEDEPWDVEAIAKYAVENGKWFTERNGEKAFIPEIRYPRGVDGYVNLGMQMHFEDAINKRISELIDSNDPSVPFPDNANIEPLPEHPNDNLKQYFCDDGRLDTLRYLQALAAYYKVFGEPAAVAATESALRLWEEAEALSKAAAC